MLTIHDAAFQGHVGAERLGALGVNGRCYTPAGLEWYGRVNLLKGGIAFADQVVVTSPAHAAELCTSAGGFGLDGIFRWRRTALAGIRSGLDATRWNPATDALITTRFGPGTVGDRAKNKQALQRSAKLPVRARTPVVLLPAPLTLRTGASLALASALLRSGDAQLVIGASGEHALVDEARALSGEFPDRVALLPLWDDRMERRALAGADIVLAPSRHEPSGLLASRALRYGAVVVLRATGAHGDLADSDALFRFQSFDGASLDRALGTALDAFADKAAWAARVKAALSIPVGWGDAVSAYDARYLAALAPGAVA